MSVFISYASADKIIVDTIDRQLLSYGANIYRDERELKPLDNIISFMKMITKHDYAIAVISSSYLKSKACVFEMTEFLKKENAHKRIVPIYLNDFKINNPFKITISGYIDSQIVGIDEEDWKDRFNTTWEFISNTKLFNYQDEAANKFHNILAYLNVHHEAILNSIDEIRDIKDREVQEIVLNKLLKIHPGSYHVLFFRAYLFTIQDQQKKAIFYFEEFLSKFPAQKLDIFLVYYNVAVCYSKLNEHEKAIEYHKKTIAIFPHAYLSYMGLGDAYLGLQDYSLSYQSYKHAQMYIKTSGLIGKLGYLELKRGNISQAIKLLEEAIAIDDQNPEFYINLGVAYRHHLEDYESYDRIISTAYKKLPDNPKILTAYAMHCVHDGNKLSNNGILEILKKSFSIDPNNIHTRIYYALLITSIYNKENDIELDFAKQILYKTLEIDLEENEKNLCIDLFRTIFIHTKDEFSLKLFEKKYGKI